MKQDPVCTTDDHELFGITIFRQAVAAWQDAVVAALYDLDHPITSEHALSMTNEVKRLVKLTAQWFEQHFCDQSGTFETTLQFLDVMHSDLLIEGRECFLLQTEGKSSWSNPETEALWTAGVNYIYLLVLRKIRDDDTNLRQTYEVPVKA